MEKSCYEGNKGCRALSSLSVSLLGFLRSVFCVRGRLLSCSKVPVIANKQRRRQDCQHHATMRKVISQTHAYVPLALAEILLALQLAHDERAVPLGQRPAALAAADARRRQVALVVDQRTGLLAKDLLDARRALRCK